MMTLDWKTGEETNSTWIILGNMQRAEVQSPEPDRWGPLRGMPYWEFQQCQGMAWDIREGDTLWQGIYGKALKTTSFFRWLMPTGQHSLTTWEADDPVLEPSFPYQEARLTPSLGLFSTTTLLLQHLPVAILILGCCPLPCPSQIEGLSELRWPS